MEKKPTSFVLYKTLVADLYCPEYKQYCPLAQQGHLGKRWQLLRRLFSYQMSQEPLFGPSSGDKLPGGRTTFNKTILSKRTS